MVPFWVPNIIRHLLFRVPKRTLILTTTHLGFRGLGLLESRLAGTHPQPVLKRGLGFRVCLSIL